MAEPPSGVLYDAFGQAKLHEDFDSLDALAEQIVAFEDHWQQVAQPFEWTFTRRDLDALMARLAGREPQLRLAA